MLNRQLTQNNFFTPIQGYRSFAALGVVWVHIWAFQFNNISLPIFGLDIFKAISVVGNGVDFFFVISGFLMYMALYAKPFTLNTFSTFIKKRFLRIAPLYYVSILVYFLVSNGFFDGAISIKEAFIDALFLNNHFKVNIAYTFWSLAVEWWFYCIIPFLFISKNLKIRLVTFALISFLGLLRLTQLQLNSDLFITPDMPLPLFIEFGWGILIGFLITNEKFKNIRMKQSFLNISIALIILYLGRVMRLTEFVQYNFLIGTVGKIMSGPIMTLGFAMLVFMSLTSNGHLSRFLSLPIFQFLGKLSYGIYLWHVLFITVASLIVDPNAGPFVLLLTFVAVSLCSIGLSWLTYHLIELRYFQSKISSQAKN